MVVPFVVVPLVSAVTPKIKPEIVKTAFGE
jgi:hypothetical protein